MNVVVMWKLICLLLAVLFTEVLTFTAEECKSIKRPEAMYSECCVYNGPPDDDDVIKRCEVNTLKDECLTDCTFREKKFLNGNKLDIPAVKAFTKTQLPAAVWDPIIDRTFTNCSKEIENKPLIEGCKTLATQFAGCILVHLTTSCPDSLWNSEEKCTELKTYINECQASYFGTNPSLQ